MQSLVVAFVLTRLDYANATLTGLADQLLVSPQRSFDLHVAQVQSRDAASMHATLTAFS